jgi:hypothetical protein
MGLPTITLLDNGEVKLFYRLFGYSKRKPLRNDYIDTFIPGLSPNSYATAWDMYHNGATLYNVKGLLASTTGDVISDVNSVVRAVWKENGVWHILTDKKLFSCISTPVVTVGDVVRKGTPLSSGIKFFTGTDTPSFEDIPGIKIRVDAGELVAYNKKADIIAYGSNHHILPLEGDHAIVDNYKSRCRELIDAGEAPYIPISTDNVGKVNPYSFVMSTLRKSRSLAVKLTVKTTDNIAAAIRCIRKCASASSMINIYIKTEADTHSLTEAKMTASAGLGAVAVAVSVNVQGTYAEAKILR